MIALTLLKAWLADKNAGYVAVSEDGSTLELKYDTRDLHPDSAPDDDMEIGDWSPALEVDPRERGDDDGVEYADPRDARDGTDR